MATSSRHAEALVALAAANSVSSAEAPRRGSSAQQLILIPEQYRKNAPLVEERTARIADALAAILVEQKHGEVYAVGIQVDFRTFGHVTLTVAPTQGVPMQTANYLEKVWATLFNLSQYYRKRQKKDAAGAQRYTDTTPPRQLGDEDYPGPFSEAY